MPPAQALAYPTFDNHASAKDMAEQITVKPLSQEVKADAQAVDPTKPVSFPTTLGDAEAALRFYLPVLTGRQLGSDLLKSLSDDLHAAAPAGLDLPTTPVTVHLAYQNAEDTIASLAPKGEASRHVMVLPLDADQSLHAQLRDNLDLHRAIDQIAGRGRFVMISDFSAAAEEIEAIEAFKNIETKLSLNEQRAYQHALNLAMAAAMSSFEATSSLTGVVNSIRGMQQSLSSYSAVAGKDEAAMDIRQNAVQVEAQLQAQISNPNLPEAARAGLQAALNALQQQRKEATAEANLHAVLTPGIAPTIETPVLQAQLAVDAKTVASVQPANVNAIGIIEAPTVAMPMTAPLTVTKVIDAKNIMPTQASNVTSSATPVETIVQNTTRSPTAVPTDIVVAQPTTSIPAAITPANIAAATTATVSHAHNAADTIPAAAPVAAVVMSQISVTPGVAATTAPAAVITNTVQNLATPPLSTVVPVSIAALQNNTVAATPSVLSHMAEVIRPATVVSIAEARAAQPLTQEVRAHGGGDNVIVAFRAAATDSAQPQTSVQGLPAVALMVNPDLKAADRDERKTAAVIADNDERTGPKGFDPLADYYEKKSKGADGASEERRGIPLGFTAPTNDRDGTPPQTGVQPPSGAPQQAVTQFISGMQPAFSSPAQATLGVNQPTPAQSGGIQQPMGSLPVANGVQPAATQSLSGLTLNSSTPSFVTLPTPAGAAFGQLVATQANGQTVPAMPNGMQQPANANVLAQNNQGGNPAANVVVSLTTQNPQQSAVPTSPIEQKVVNPLDRSAREVYEEIWQEEQAEKKRNFLLGDWLDAKKVPDLRDDERRDTRHEDYVTSARNANDNVSFALSPSSSSFSPAHLGSVVTDSNENRSDVKVAFKAAATGACAGCSGGNCNSCMRGSMSTSQADAIKAALKAEFG